MAPTLLSAVGAQCCTGIVCQPDLHGACLFQHRRTLKFRLRDENYRVPGALYEGECLSFLEEFKQVFSAAFQPLPEAPLPEPVRSLVAKSWLVRGASNVIRTAEFLCGGTSHARSWAEWQFNADGTITGSQDPQTSAWSYEEVASGVIVKIGDGLTYNLALLPVSDTTSGLSWTTADLGSAPELTLWERSKVYPSDVVSHHLHFASHIHVFLSSADLSEAIHAFLACLSATRAGAHITFATPFHEWFTRFAVTNLHIIPLEESHRHDANFLDLSYDRPWMYRYGAAMTAWFMTQLRSLQATPSPPPRLTVTDSTLPLSFGQFVVFIPFDDCQSKLWSPVHWNRLAHLIDCKNYQVVVVAPPGRESATEEIFGDTRAVWVLNDDPQVLQDIMLATDGIIGIDTGLTQMAGLLRVRTLCLHAQTSQQFSFSSIPSVLSIQPESTCVPCRFQFDRGYTSSCAHGCSAMHAINPEYVLRAAEHYFLHDSHRKKQCQHRQRSNQNTNR